MQEIKYGMGWIPDLPDFRDIKFRAMSDQVFPMEFSKRAMMPALFDQGSLGSCVWNGISAAHMHNQSIQGDPSSFMPSRLFGYYYTRVMEGTVNSDCGCMIRDGVKVLASMGVCSEIEWGYDISKFKDKPTKQCDDDAIIHKSLQYFRVDQNENDIKSCLYGDGKSINSGFPIVFGATLYNSFQSNSVALSGIVPMPSRYEAQIGGHCMTIIGWKYIDNKLYWEVRNSWSERWGDKGHCFIPSDYLCNEDLACDFWKITLIEDK